MKEINFRKDKIVRLCQNKNVLHLGFIQHDLYEEKIKQDDWLHSKIVKVAKSLVGFDYLKNDVKLIKNKYGYEVYYADVMNLEEVNLEKKFDIIVCGELIEHIENPGLMLDGIKRFMNIDTKLIITTPNPWMTDRINLINSGVTEETWLNKEHVSWYSYQTLKQLLERKEFEEENYDYYYGNSIADFYNNTKGIIGKLRLLKRKYILNETSKENYDGLFFVARYVK